MKKVFTLILLCFSVVTFAQEHHHEDPNPNITPFHDARDAKQGISTLHLNQLPTWQAFIQKYPTWGARFNRFTKLPHRAFGAPIAFTNGSSDLVAKSLAFIQQELAGYELPTNALEVTRTFNDGKYINVDFKQVHENKEILWSRMALRYSQQNELVMFGADVHTNVPSNLPSTLSEQDAINYAQNALVTTVVSSTISPKQMIMPVPNENGHYDFKLVYEVITNTNNGHEPGKYLSYVDAVSGEILYRDNYVKHIGFTVEADAYPTNLFSASQFLPLQHLLVQDGSSTLYTDENGFVNTAGLTANPTLRLEGRYCEIVTGQNGNTVYTHSASTVSIPNSTVQFPAGSGTNPPQIQHFTAYHHVNVVHDHLKSYLPAFPNLDNPLLTRIDRTDGNCNAFYNGNSINFYTTSNGCNALSLVNTVIYHEYGHAITNEFWDWQGQNFQNGAVGEGYSDMWSMSITDDPIVGRGFNIGQANSFIRRYDVNPKVYPQNLVGQVHADGEIIAGAWWDSYQYWGDLDSLTNVFAQSHFGVANGPNGTEGEVYFDILIDALQYDDDDNDLSNGTPHFIPITKGFADHGIFLLSNTKLLHTSIGAVNSGAPINVSAEAVSDFPAFLGLGKLVYRQEGTTTTSTVNMTKNGNIYSVVFPSQAAGEVYEYYFEVEDAGGSYSIYAPENVQFNISSTQRNIPYSLLIGFRAVWSELFDNGTPAGWTVGNAAGDNATRGLWEVGTPIPSFRDLNDSATLCQTYYDVSGNNTCAFTGNAPNAFSGFGQADVDGGLTTLISPTINISAYNDPYITYFRWYSNSQGSNPGKDFWEAEINYGTSTWFDLERTFVPDVRWRMNTVRLSQTAGTDIQLRFRAGDITQGGGGGSIVEAAIDGVVIYERGETPLAVNNYSGDDFNIYPNPSKGKINVVFPYGGKANYQVLNTTGQVLIKKSFSAAGSQLQTIDLEHLSNGVYFVQMEQNGHVKTDKITLEK